jgi:hypothetical protein
MIDFRSEKHTTAQGAHVEVATMTHEGRDYTALGSLVDLQAGRIMGYLHELPGDRDRFYLTSWDGCFMYILLRRVSTWKTPRSYVSTTYSAFRTVIDGYVYSGRGAGSGMFIRLKKGRKAT